MPVVKKIFILCALLFIAAASVAAKSDLTVASIPAAILANADAVVRFDEVNIEITAASKMQLRRKYAITIFNEEGAEYARLVLFKNKFMQADHISGTLYDSSGVELRSVKKKDVRILSPYTGSLTDDVSYQVFDFGYGVYPFTCEYEYDQTFTSLAFIPDWAPQKAYNCAVISSSISVEYPKDISISYRTFHLRSSLVSTTADDSYTLTDTVNNIAAMEKPEHLAPEEDTRLPLIMFSAEQLEMLGNKGSMATWEKFGDFFYKLNDGRDILPEAVKKTVHELTDSCTVPECKIAILYKYLQKNTRYVSIQLGIGGWQTFEAGFVAEKGYGDCKALSNYMKALLKEAGITSYATLIYGGLDNTKKMLQDFPHMVFNHVILCVPVRGDTTWLECTSSTLPAGYLSAFTDSRSALLLTPDGGVPVHTPQNKQVDNRLVRKGIIEVDGDDNLSGTVEMDYIGHFWDGEHHVADDAKTKVDDVMNRKLRISSYTVVSYSVANERTGKKPSLKEKIVLKGEGAINKAGQKKFLNGNVFDNYTTIPPFAASRKTPFRLSQSYIIDDTVIFRFAGSYAVDAYKGGDMDMPFASYHYKVIQDAGNEVKIILSYAQKAGIYPAAQYVDYVKLHKQMRADKSSKLMLTKKE